MDTPLSIRRRKQFTSDYNGSTERIHRFGKLLFDEVGTFHVRLILLSKRSLNKDCTQLTDRDREKKEVRCRKDVDDLVDHLLKSSEDELKVM